MPIQSISDFASDGPEGEKVDGTKLPPFGPGGIYHEKQVGAMCAKHCINNLLQGPLFDEGMLSDVALRLDAEERRLLGGAAGLEDGGNVRSDGFYNVQVIRVVLERAGFTMDPLTAEDSRKILNEPAKQQGFILNKREHWFSLRRIGREWFDLNSCLRNPRHFTDSDLSHQVSDATKEGYSVFVVRGEFPRCALEDDHKKLLEAVQGCGHYRQGHCLFAGEGQSLGGGSSQPAAAAIDPELAAAAANDPELAAAIAASMADAAPQVAARSAADEKEEMRRKRLARFG